MIKLLRALFVIPFIVVAVICVAVFMVADMLVDFFMWLIKRIIWGKNDPFD